MLGDLGLPDRDYYTKTRCEIGGVAPEIPAHVQRMLELLGDLPDAAERESAGIMAMETALAKASLTRVERREPHNLYHKVDLTQLQALTPGFDWSSYLKETGLGRTGHIQCYRTGVL